MEVVQRIKDLVNDKAKSKREFAALIGIEQVTFNNYMIGKRSLSYDTVEAILRTFPDISAEWLMRGEGSMLKSEYNEDKPKISYTTGVPYYNVDFIGGFDLVLNDQTVNPEYNIDFRMYNKADCWCNVTGHSMEPEISQGDIIALKELHDWQTYIPSGEIYAIVTTEQRTIKRVSPGKHEGYILLTPSNPSPEYVPQEIPLSIVQRVYRVLGCMKIL